MRMRTLRFLLRKEFLQIRRDRAMLRMLIGVPVVQLLLLSSAATFVSSTTCRWRNSSASSRQGQ